MADDDKNKGQEKDVTFWKGESERLSKNFDDLVKQRDELKATGRANQARLDALEAEAKDRAAKEAKSKEDQDRQRLEGEGKYKEALESSQKKFQGELDTLRQASIHAIAPGAIRSAAMKVQDVIPDAIGDIEKVLSPFVRVEFVNGRFETTVVGEDGKPLKDEKLAPVSVESFVSSEVQKRSWWILGGVSTGSGAKLPGNAGTKIIKPEWTPEAALANPRVNAEWAKADPEGYAKAFQEYNSPFNAQRRAQEAMKAKGLA